MEKRYVFRLILIFFASVLLVACTNENGNNEGADGVNTDPIVVVLFPHESGPEFRMIHDEIERLIYEATGRPGEVMTTIDNNVAIEAISQGVADIAYLGVASYFIAREQNPNVRSMFTPSGPSGTLDDAVYFSFLAVREEDVHLWEDGQGGFDLSGLEGEIFSFVSLTSTSGFVVPGEAIVDLFDLDSTDELAISGTFFEEVLFAGSHQASAFSVLNGQVNVAAFLDMEAHFEHVGGPLNAAGMIYQVREDAEVPLVSRAGDRLVIIKSTPVPNGPFVANMNTLTEEEVTAITAIFTSDAVANNENFFGTPESDTVSWEVRGTGNERFVPVDTTWYEALTGN